MAGLFKNKIIKEKIERYEIPDFERKIALVKQWSDAYTNGELQKKTETQCEQAFNQDFFIHILGYSAFPKENYTIQPKDNVDSGGGQIPDATLGYFNDGYKRVIAVVEIKDANTPLDKSQRREGSLSPIQQAFKYKPQFKECGFVIATNFFEIRLFRDNQLDYEQFTLSELVDPKNNYFNFRKFFYLLNVKNFITEKGQTETEMLLSAIRIEQEKITNKFYNKYKKLREDLINDIVKNNTEIKRPDFYSHIVEKAQKIVDRVVFICFFEDSGLLPDNKLIEVVEFADKHGLSSWTVMKDFFTAVDVGSSKMEIPDGYNGELFKQDNDLNNLIISDTVCKSFVDFSKFDFQEDLSVNILGHIFEQSITDLERLKKYSESSEIVDIKKETKRKKDGIFYTPEYIVDSIIRKSLGRYLEDKEQEILAKHKLDSNKIKTDKTYDTRAFNAYTEYRDALYSIKVLDPACGSGAFLVKVFDYLVSEHKRISNIIADIKGTASLLSSEDYIKTILQNNIYGVDINPESIEITKLSLWLKSAKKGHKLVTLKENIKCGNSLINNPEIAGISAFNWSKEFSEILTGGGFDVIIGNPPYIKEYTNRQAFDGLHSNPYYEGKMDLWQFFACLGIDLLKKNGYLSYIAPSSWLTNSGAKKTRNKILKESKIIEFIDFGDYNVFSQAGIQTMIFVLKKTGSDDGKLIYTKFTKSDDIENSLSSDSKIDFKQSDHFDKTITFIESKDDVGLLDKILSQKNFELTPKEIAQGIVFPQDFVNKKSHSIVKSSNIGDGIFALSEREKNNLNLSHKDSELVKPYYTTEQINRYYSNNKNRLWIIYTDSRFKDKKLIDEYINIKLHLDKFTDVMTSSNKPYGLHRARDERFFVGEKIVVVRKCPDRPIFSYVDFESYLSATFYIIKSDRINIKYLTGLLNSNLVRFWLKNRGKMQGNNFQLDKEPLLEIPIHKANNDTENEVIVRVDEIIKKNVELKEMTIRTIELLRHQLGLEKTSKKLEKLFELDFDNLIALSKKELPIGIKGEMLDYFTKEKRKILELRNEISRIDNEIDNLVYGIYALNEEEIKTIKELK